MTKNEEIKSFGGVEIMGGHCQNVFTIMLMCFLLILLYNVLDYLQEKVERARCNQGGNEVFGKGK